MGEHDWKVVWHKRGGNRRTSGTHGAQQNTLLPSSKNSSATDTGIYPKPRPLSESHATPPNPRPNDKDEEERLFRKMQRAISKVEQSVFFVRFMKQMQDLEVLKNLSRSRMGKARVLEEDEQVHEMVNEGGQEEPSSSLTVELVVYGVGSITNSEISRCQLSLALLLKRKLAEIKNVWVYDPVMSVSDRSVMLQLGVSPLEDNDEGRRPLNGPTLFYMPHCDVELYETVLQANLKPGTVDQLVILGNSFRTYQHRWSVSPLPHGERPHCLLKVQPTVDEIPLADNFSPTAFNDTSWHFFSRVEVSPLQ